MTKPKPKEKATNVEGFFRAIQEDLVAVRRDMATKDELRQIRGEMVTKAELREIRDDVKRLTDVVVSKADLANTIREEVDKSPYAKEKEVEDLRARVLRLEEKLGMKAGRR